MQQRLVNSDTAHRRGLVNSDMGQYGFFNKINWTAESLFTRGRIVNRLNMLHQPAQTRRAPGDRVFQQLPGQCLAGLVGNRLFGPHIFKDTLTGERYLHFCSTL